MKLTKKDLIFVYEKIEELIFPPCCLICGKLGVNIWCNECKEEILEKAVYQIETKDKKEFYFEQHMYLFFYQDKIRDLILDYKFKDKAYLYQIFSEIITKNKKIRAILKKYDIMVPIPIHTKRKKQRGYNQSELIAKEVTKEIKEVRYEPKVIKKEKNTLPQSSLTKKQRKQNVQHVYKVINQEKIKNNKIILLDDIYTTGSTVNEIAKQLKEHGAKEILVLTIAKD